MNDDRPLVLSRSAITIVSLLAAWPMAALPLLQGPPANWVISIAYWPVAIMFFGGMMLTALFLITMVVVELIYRRVKLIGFRRLPWFSFSYAPVVFLSGEGFAWMLASLTESGWVASRALCAVGVAAFFQVVGLVSLSQQIEAHTFPIDEQPHDPGSRGASL